MSTLKSILNFTIYLKVIGLLLIQFSFQPLSAQIVTQEKLSRLNIELAQKNLNDSVKLFNSVFLKYYGLEKFPNDIKTFDKNIEEVIVRTEEKNNLQENFLNGATNSYLNGDFIKAEISARCATLLLDKSDKIDLFVKASDRLALSLISQKKHVEAINICSSLIDNKKYKTSYFIPLIYSKRGIANFEKNDFKKALKDYLIAEELSKKLKIPDVQINVLFNISKCYEEMNNLKMAIDYMYRVFEINRFNESANANKTLLYDRIGFLLARDLQLKKSYAYLTLARNLCPSENIRLKNQIEINMSLYELKSGNIKAAKEIIFRIENNESLIVQRKRDINFILGQCFFYEKNILGAKKKFKIAIELAEDINSKGYKTLYNLEVIAASKKKLSILNLNPKDFEKSYKLLEQSFREKEKILERSKDSILNKVVNHYELNDRQNKIKELRKNQKKVKLEIEKTKKNSLLLKFFILLSSLGLVVFITAYFKKRKKVKQEKKNRELIERQNKYLVESLEQKGLLLKEIHHRVKNNFQMIISLLQMQAENEGYLNVENFLVEATNRILSISIVHENLYEGDELDKISFKEYINKLILNSKEALIDKNKLCIFDIDINDIIFDLNTTIPLGLIINELIINSIKHSKDNDTIIISISLEKKGNINVLSYSDNNIAITEGEKRGFGTELIELLTLQLSGELEIIKEEYYFYQIYFSNE